MYYHAVADELAGRPTILVICNGLSLLLSLSHTLFISLLYNLHYILCTPHPTPGGIQRGLKVSAIFVVIVSFVSHLQLGTSFIHLFIHRLLTLLYCFKARLETMADMVSWDIYHTV